MQECGITSTAYKNFVANITDFRSINEKIGPLWVKTKYFNVWLFHLYAPRDEDIRTTQ